MVGTLMTNLALELALARQGIGLKRTAVGDKYVLEEMLRSGISLGGEPSGHIIFSDLSLAGDGMITLLEVLRLLAETGQPFDELLRGYQPFPQLIRNVRVREKPPLESIPSVAQAITECCTELGERGRVVVRYSGTEPLARVMVEGAEAASRGGPHRAHRRGHRGGDRIGSLSHRVIGSLKSCPWSVVRRPLQVTLQVGKVRSILNRQRTRFSMAR